jgi:hypothetical protein
MRCKDTKKIYIWQFAFLFVFLHRQVRRKTDDETDSYVPCCRHGDSRFVGGVEGK